MGRLEVTSDQSQRPVTDFASRSLSWVATFGTTRIGLPAWLRTRKVAGHAHHTGQAAGWLCARGASEQASRQSGHLLLACSVEPSKQHTGGHCLLVCRAVLPALLTQKRSLKSATADSCSPSSSSGSMSCGCSSSPLSSSSSTGGYLRFSAQYVDALSLMHALRAVICAWRASSDLSSVRPGTRMLEFRA